MRGGRRHWRRWAGRWLAAAILTILVAGTMQGRAAETCRRVHLVDGATGIRVVGPEDVVADPVSGRLYLSAFDRWALEDALDADAATLPRGGIYAAPLAAVSAADDSLRVRKLAEGGSTDFHPHGIAVYHGGHRHRLFAINHAYHRSANGWRRRTRIEAYRIEPDGLRHVASLDSPRLCQANDLAALSGDDLVVSRDHGACDAWGKLAEDVLGLRRAEVVLARLPGGETEAEPDALPASRARPASPVVPLIDDLGFANGVAISPDGRRLAVAATREKAIRLYDLKALLRGTADRPLRRIRLDGGPDNLNWHAGAGLLAAVHPSLLKAGLARHRWLGFRRAGSRVTAVASRGGGVATLWNDPEGTRLNAATAATAFGETLVVGSALDDAVVVCGLGGSLGKDGDSAR